VVAAPCSLHRGRYVWGPVAAHDHMFTTTGGLPVLAG
jgi:hypothetical protein